MTRSIGLPAHFRTYLALGAVAAVAFYCAHFRWFVPGALALFGGLGLVWLVGQSRVSVGDDAITVRPFGLLGGSERLPTTRFSRCARATSKTKR